MTGYLLGKNIRSQPHNDFRNINLIKGIYLYLYSDNVLEICAYQPHITPVLLLEVSSTLID